MCIRDRVVEVRPWPKRLETVRGSTPALSNCVDVVPEIMDPYSAEPNLPPQLLPAASGHSRRPRLLAPCVG